MYAHLPLLAGERELDPPPALAVAQRAVAASYVAAVSFGADAAGARKYLERFGLWVCLSERERMFLQSGAFAPEQRAQFGWMVESLQFLAWSLGLVELDHFRHCDDALASVFPFDAAPAAFFAAATLRTRGEIRQEADTLCMLHWAARQAQLDGQPSRIMLPVVQHRRHAAEWIVGTAEEWDDVGLDT